MSDFKRKFTLKGKCLTDGYFKTSIMNPDKFLMACLMEKSEAYGKLVQMREKNTFFLLNH